MLGRLLWRLITPRQLRKGTLIVLLAWLMIALAYQNGVIPRADDARPPVSLEYSSP